MNVNEKSDVVPSCCCDSDERVEVKPWFAGWIDTAVAKIPRVSTQLIMADKIGAIGVRLSIGRMNYTVAPGLYAVGNPDGVSPVLVSANYKLSFDALRRELGGMDVWILVLDTKGVNVWCAAGKGTFSTAELVSRIQSTNLAKIVTNRRLILPQLSAPGVAAHLVKKDCGFSVIYGPVRAKDLKSFIMAGLSASPEMRVVRFDLVDRLVVIPVEFVEWFVWILVLAFVMLVSSGIVRGGYNYALVWTRGVWAVAVVVTSYFVGGIVTPCLLPWLPGRAFSMKGLWVGVGLAILISTAGSSMFPGAVAWVEETSYILIICAVTSFMAMNYTGTSTFTSQSGVKKEMRIFMPLQAVALVTGIVLWVATGVIL